MNIEHLRWWHWLLISICVGALLAGSRDFYGPTYDDTVTGTLQESFPRYVANPPINGGEKDFARFVHPPCLEQVVVHPPIASKLKESMAYVMDVKTDSATVEVEVQKGMIIAHRDKASKGDSLILPVLWKDVPLAQLPGDVSSAATTAIPGTVVAAYYGPSNIEYVVTMWGIGIGERYAPGSQASNNPENVLTYKPIAMQYVAKVPFKPRGNNMVIRDLETPVWATNHVEYKPWPVSPKFDRAKAPAEFPTVLAYLDALKAKYPSLPLSYRYAWWEERQWVYILWIGGCVLVIGVIWPAVLYLLTGAGLGRAAEPEYDLSRFKPQKKKGQKKAAGAADLSGVNALNAQLEAGLMANAGASSAAPATTAAVVNENPFSSKKSALVEGEPAQAASEKAADQPKSFGIEGGSYYPTEIHVSKKLSGKAAAKK